jgi:hypothetical protein
MSLSSLLESLTRRDAAPPAAGPPHAGAYDEIAHLLEHDALQFVAANDADADLGALQEVRERIADVLPGVVFDEDGHGAFTRTGYAVEFETGREERVTTVRVHVVGGAAAAPPLQRLASKTGWRLEAA